ASRCLLQRSAAQSARQPGGLEPGASLVGGPSGAEAARTGGSGARGGLSAGGVSPGLVQSLVLPGPRRAGAGAGGLLHTPPATARADPGTLDPARRAGRLGGASRCPGRAGEPAVEPALSWYHAARTAAGLGKLVPAGARGLSRRSAASTPDPA